MLPFFRSPTEIRVEPVMEESVQPGDILTVLSRSASLFTHRVIRVLEVGGQRVFLTKGDNRLQFDPVVFPEEVVGRVVWAGGRDLRRRGWRLLGQGIALLSYAQAVAYHRLLWGWPNRLRRLLERRGWFPRVRLVGVFQLMTNPIGWVPGSPLVESAGVRLGRASAWSRGVRVRPVAPGDLERMVQAWNAAFPRQRVTPERLRARLPGDAPADGWRCLAAWRGGDLLGWGGARFSGGAWGSLEFIALTEAGRRSGADGFIFLELLAWLRRRGARDLSFGPLPAAEIPGGAALPDPMRRIALQRGFHALPPLVEMRLERGLFRRGGPADGGDGFRIRSWRPEDDRCLHSGFLGPGYNAGLVREHLDRGGNPDQILVAGVRERPVGLCQWLPDSELRDVRQVSWIWSVSDRFAGSGYLFHLVVEPAWRGRGVGKALACRAVEALFRSGCSSVACWTPVPAFFEKMGFVRVETFVWVKKEGGIR